MRSLSWSSRRSLGATVLVVLLVASLSASPAGAATKQVKINGRGWGHGIGMSQYGAFGLSTHGWGAKAILRHYYSGVKVVERSIGRDVRVGMLQGRSSITVRPRAKAPEGGRMVLKVAGSKTKIVGANPGDELRIEASSAGGALIYKNGETVKRNGRTVFGDLERPVVAKYQQFGTMVDTDGKDYAVAYGKLEFVSYRSSGCPAGKCLSEVAVLGMQKYLYGLGEVPASWPQESLRAQAIAGRTYAYAKVLAGQMRVPCYCGLYDSVFDQVFVGEAKRTGSGSFWKAWKRAVDTTHQKVVLHDGKPITALYSSSSGGHTESNSIVWGTTQVPYLRGVEDPFDRAGGANPNFRWSLTMSWPTLASTLTNSFGSFGKLRKLVIVRTGVSGRVATDGLKIVGSTRTLRVDGWDVRSALGLKDSWFRFKVIQPTTARESTHGSVAKHHGPNPTKPSRALTPAPTPSPDETAAPSPSPDENPTEAAPTPTPEPSPTISPSP